MSSISNGHFQESPILKMNEITTCFQMEQLQNNEDFMPEFRIKENLYSIQILD